MICYVFVFTISIHFAMSMYTYVYLTCDMIMTSEGGDFNMFFFVFVITMCFHVFWFLKPFSCCCYLSHILSGARALIYICALIYIYIYKIHTHAHTYTYIVLNLSLLLINYSGYLFVCVYLFCFLYSLYLSIYLIFYISHISHTATQPTTEGDVS